MRDLQPIMVGKDLALARDQLVSKAGDVYVRLFPQALGYDDMSTDTWQKGMYAKSF